MRRWIPALAALLAFWMLPGQGTEIGELKPAALLSVRRQGSTTIVETDTRDQGAGEDITAALADLRRSTAGHIYLDTTEILILTADTLDTLPQLARLLRPATQVCLAGTAIDPEEAFSYLRIHKPRTAILDIRHHRGTLQSLRQKEGRYYLE